MDTTNSRRYPPPSPCLMSSQRIHRLVGLSEMILTVLMVIGFFEFNWIDYGKGTVDVPDESGTVETDVPKGSAWVIWSGSDSRFIYRFNEDYHDETGLDQVATIDRSLIIIPIFAVILGISGLLYATQKIINRRLQVFMVMVAALLFAYPFFWDNLKERSIESDKYEFYKEIDFAKLYSEAYGDPQLSELVANQMDDDTLRDMAEFETSVITLFFSTEEQKILGSIAFIAALLALLIELGNDFNTISPIDPTP